jgi:hypothetical protein
LFQATQIDALVLERFVLLKSEQTQAPAVDREKYLAQFQLD